MFTVVAQKDLTDAKRYFREHLSRNDYYAAAEIRPGQWIGLGADRLELTGSPGVTGDQFEAFCENRHPLTDLRLTLRQNEKSKRRVFYDFTCSAPKSVSVLAVTMNDGRLIQAHENAVAVAFRELEMFAATRVRKEGRQANRTTGNLVAARFTHTTSRSLDPQLHTHCTVFNATFDERENAWKALQAGAMYEAIRYGTAVYRNELAKRVYSLGYRAVPARHGFEIEGVSDGVLERFSQRSTQRDALVQEMEQKLGRRLTNNEIAHAVHHSRERKLQGISPAQVRERQLARLSPEELTAQRALCRAAKERKADPASGNESESLSFATSHVFERKSVSPEHELLEAALEHDLGRIDLSRLKEALRRSSGLVATEQGYSTRDILATELALIGAVEQGKAAVEPLHPTYRPAHWLGADQQIAIRHVLGSSDRITGIRGLAGTGKTTTLKELKTACEQAGYAVRFCAPTAAATEVLRKEGFDATTLATLLQDSRLDLPGKTVVVLDEAGAVGIEDMRRLLEMARRNRLVLCGDTGQHASVARGDALRIIEEHSPFTFGRLTQIRRQRRADYRRVVELAAKHETAGAFAELERLGCVTELDRDEVQRAAASAYLTAVQGGKSALLVAPTWAEIEAVTEQVRKELKARGQLGNDEQEFRVFDSLSWTEAQKRDARQYQPGQVLRFIRRAGRFARHEMVQIARVEGDTLHVCRKDGSTASLKPGRRVASSAGFDVGEARTLKVAAGDKLLLQANRSRQFVNGELVQVRDVEGETIRLTDGRTIPADYRTFTHGYAVTSHAAQGKTVDAVFVVASSRSMPAIHRQQFYVSVSRGRDQCQVYTDDKELLRARVTHSSARLAAVEAVTGSRGRVKALAYDAARRLRTVLSGLRQRIGGVRMPHLQLRAETPATRVRLGI